MKWQKRYFVLAEPKGMLYYFKSVDDPPHYKGVINIRDAKARHSCQCWAWGRWSSASTVCGVGEGPSAPFE